MTEALTILPFSIKSTGIPLTQAVPLKSVPLAFAFGFVGGPLGFFYMGWRYGLVASVFFVFESILLMPGLTEFLTSVATPLVWSLIHGIVMGGFMAVTIALRNAAVDAGDGTSYDRLRSFPSAVLAAIAVYRALVWTALVVCAVVTSFKLVAASRVLAAIVALFLIFPLLALLTGAMCWVLSRVVHSFAEWH